MKEQRKRGRVIRLIALLSVIAACGCGKGWNSAECRTAVLEEFDSVEVVQIPGEDWEYIVRDKDGSVWFAECKSDEPKVTAKALLLPPPK